jgi:hypothetical protein
LKIAAEPEEEEKNIIISFSTIKSVTSETKYVKQFKGPHVSSPTGRYHYLEA